MTTTITPRLIGTWFPQVGTRIRQNGSQPFRRIEAIEEFAEVRRCWVGGDDYIDLVRQGTVFVPADDAGRPVD